jgi:hypothetical protein
MHEGSRRLKREMQCCWMPRCTASSPNSAVSCLVPSPSLGFFFVVLVHDTPKCSPAPPSCEERAARAEAHSGGHRTGRGWFERMRVRCCRSPCFLLRSCGLTDVAAAAAVSCAGVPCAAQGSAQAPDAARPCAARGGTGRIRVSVQTSAGTPPSLLPRAGGIRQPGASVLVLLPFSAPTPAD